MDTCVTQINADLLEFVTSTQKVARQPESCALRQIAYFLGTAAIEVETLAHAGENDADKLASAK